MKNIRSFRRFTPLTLPGIIPGALAFSLIACIACAADTTAPASKDAAAAASATPPGAGSTGTNSASANVILHAISVSAGSEASESGEDVIGRIGSQEVKVKDIRAIIETLNPNEQAAIANDPAILKQVVFSLLLEPLVIKEINSKKWDQSPEVKAHLARVQRTTLANLYLKTITTPPADYPSDADLKSAYEARKNSFTVPHQFQISQIFVVLPKDADKATTEQAQKKVGDIMLALKQPNADFAAVVHSQSGDPKIVVKGGNMGWVPDTQMPDRIRLLALTLPRNTISDPIQLEDGWHIIRVTDAKDVAPLSFDEVKIPLARQLRAEKAKANLQAYIANLVQQSPITIDDKVLPEAVGKPEN